MKVTEIFYSLQGEGRLAGVPSVFIRLAGCPLRCRWCDTKYAWHTDAAAERSVPQILDAVNQWPTKFVVITGGEPMLNPDLSSRPRLAQLAQELKAAKKHITIETAGLAFIPGLPCDLMSISPKLTNSNPADPHLAAAHNHARLDAAVIAELIDHYDYQLKFVVDTEADLTEIRRTIHRIGNVSPEKVMLMPQADARKDLLEKSPLVARLCTETGFAFCQRLHILLWDNKPAT